MVHRNARLTVHGRGLIVERVLHQGRRRSHVAAEMGVSRQCVSHWINRFLAEGAAGLADRSSRPRSCPTRTPEQVEAQVLALRAEHRRGQDWIGAALAPWIDYYNTRRRHSALGGRPPTSRLA